jgi:tRNA (guanine-N7-)-methyltransferase
MVTVEDVVLDPPAEGEVVDPARWFSSPGPFELEIGCGKGGFLLSRARAAPEVRLLGIEWANKYFKYCADRMARRGVTNVRVMRTDARQFVVRHLPPECIDVLHVYHPDPWPKKRHHKRRLIEPGFVIAAVASLKRGGSWLVTSDHSEYFERIREALGAHPHLTETPWEQTQVELAADWAGTNFEVKYVREGRTIHRAAYRRN